MSVGRYAFGVALVVAAAVAQPASATVFLGAIQGANNVFVSDLGQGTPGLAQISGPVGDYNVSAAFAAQQPVISAPLVGFLSATVTANKAGGLALVASQTDVPISQISSFLSSVSGLSGQGGAQGQFQTFFDPGNAAFATTIALTDTGLQPAANFSFAEFSSLYGPFALVSFTEQVILVGDVGDARVDAFVAALPAPTQVPEPTTLAMLGVPFALFFGLTWGRRKAR